MSVKIKLIVLGSLVLASGIVTAAVTALAKPSLAPLAAGTTAIVVTITTAAISRLFFKEAKGS